MATILEDSPSASHALLGRLRQHLPNALGVLRRLTFASEPGGSTPHTHILYVHSPDSPHFAAAYADVSRGPETEVWIYSTVEDNYEATPDAERALCAEQAIRLLRRIRSLAGEIPDRAKPHGVL